MVPVRLLDPRSRSGNQGGEGVTVAGRRWQLVPYSSVTDAHYVCVSYSWGPGRVPHVLDRQREMPEKTVRVMEAAHDVVGQDLMWIDAFCVPFDDPGRAACLRSLGTIYGNAAKVVVVLTGAAARVIEEAASSGSLSEEALLAFERDDWVSRAWTYQELVNARQVHFVTDEGHGATVPATRLFDAVGKALEQFRLEHGLDHWAFRERHPQLDALESLIGDWRVSERSAFLVMAAMATRHAVHPDEVFYAMVGAITGDLTPSADDETASAAEYFMRVCERKSDFSFVYCRRNGTNRAWRPLPHELQPVLAWHSDGSLQTGDVTAEKLRLHHLILTDPGRMTAAATTFVRGALHALGVDREAAIGTVPTAIVQSFNRAGFNGCGEYVECEQGYFFPVHPIPASRNWRIAIATEIFWTFGTPALLLSPDDSPSMVLDVGVFVGRVTGDAVSLEFG